MQRMSERRFYCPELAVGLLRLPEEEAHHARHVLRVRSGDEIRLFDGRGSQADARVLAIDRHGVEVSVERLEPPRRSDRPLPVTVAVAMPKGARQDTLVEKCTELGVEALWPILTARTVVRPRPGRHEHWRRVGIAAAKQAGRAYLPAILSPMPFAELVGCLHRFDLALFGDSGAEAEPLLSHLESRPPGGRSLVAIGPEGGFTPEEQTALGAAGAVPVRLSRWTLRTETAAIDTTSIAGRPNRRMTRPA